MSVVWTDDEHNFGKVFEGMHDGRKMSTPLRNNSVLLPTQCNRFHEQSGLVGKSCVHVFPLTGS